MLASRNLALAAMAGGGLLLLGNALLLADPDARGLASGADYLAVIGYTLWSQRETVLTPAPSRA